MVKIVYDIIVKLTLTYSSLIGTGIIVAGLCYLFIYHDGGASVGIVTVGAGLVLGRAITKGVVGKAAMHKETGVVEEVGEGQ